MLRGRVVTFATPELKTIRTARGPRSPRRPLAVDGGADLVARLLLNVRAFAAGTTVDGCGLVASSCPFSNPATALRVAFRPLAPRAPFAGN